MTPDAGATAETSTPQAKVVSEVRASIGRPALWLAGASVRPAVGVAGWLLAALPLVVLHVYRPLPAVVFGAIVAFVRGTLRDCPRGAGQGQPCVDGEVVWR